MTAFGRATQNIGPTELEWEIKSLNNRYLELNFRLPEAYRGLEFSFRDQAKQGLARGKVDIALRINRKTQTPLRLDQQRLQQLKQYLNDVEIELGVTTTPTSLDILKWPGLLVEPRDDDLSDTVIDGFALALADLQASREREGQALKQLLTARVNDIRVLADKLERQIPALQQKQHQRLVDKLEELGLNSHSERIEQELVILAHKSDVAEELDRLRTHCTELERILSSGGACGRRLDFMMQEFNREANTLGSKAVGSAVSQTAVDIKVLIEQMREQVQNIE